MQTTVKQVISTRMRVANTETEERQYDIFASIIKTDDTSNVMNDGTNGSISDGVVYDKDGNRHIALFYSGSDESLNISYFISDKDVRAAILSEVEAFCEACRQFIDLATVNVTTNTITD